MKNSKIGFILKDVTSGVIVQQVNAQGVMKSGIALSIRNKWPKVWESYSAVIKPNQSDHGLSYMGQVIYVEVEDGLWIANIVGQQYYGRDSSKVYTSYESLEKGFDDIAEFAKSKNLDVHYPLIGCGLGGGDWITVSCIIDEKLDTITHTLWELPK